MSQRLDALTISGSSVGETRFVPATCCMNLRFFIVASCTLLLHLFLLQHRNEAISALHAPPCLMSLNNMHLICTHKATSPPYVIHVSLKAVFHWRLSRSQSHNQKCKAIRSTCSENKTDWVGSRTLILLMTPSLTCMIKWKLHCRSHKQKGKINLTLSLPRPTYRFYSV